MEHPLLYEINSRCWLRSLSDRLGRVVTLADVPDSEFAQWQRLGFTHIWLMGVWKTGERARQMAIDEPNLRSAYDWMIPGWTAKDVGGSPYSIADYSVPQAMGGDSGLMQFRKRLNALGIKLILDFVPNHMGFDHPWVAHRPELFVQSATETDGTFAQSTSTGIKWIANAKDPYFPPWSDVAQLDYRRAGTREAMKSLLLSVAGRCDGVRCDMAMLLLNDVIARTWSHMPAKIDAPAGEFWPGAIAAVKRISPTFLFMAEVYWGLESQLQSLGFDYTYDKSLYDDLVWRNHAWAQQRLLESPPEYMARSVHFIENHDEHRVAEKLAPDENVAAAAAILTLPGMRFLHEGQLTGAKIKIPVQLSRRPDEPVQADVQAGYEKLLEALSKTSAGKGRGIVLTPRAAWPGNPTGQNFIVVQWQTDAPGFDIVAINLAPHPSQCYVSPDVAGLSGHDWKMRDLLTGEEHPRTGGLLAQDGLYLDLSAHRVCVFQCKPTA